MLQAAENGPAAGRRWRRRHGDGAGRGCCPHGV